MVVLTKNLLAIFPQVNNCKENNKCRLNLNKPETFFYGTLFLIALLVKMPLK